MFQERFANVTIKVNIISKCSLTIQNFLFFPGSSWLFIYFIILHSLWEYILNQVITSNVLKILHEQATTAFQEKINNVFIKDASKRFLCITIFRECY